MNNANRLELHRGGRDNEEDELSADEAEKLFQEASRLRAKIVTAAEQLHQVCALLYTRVRRNPSDLTYPFVSISNAGRRFAGSVIQGAKRTEAVDRILLATKKAAEEAKEHKEAQQRQEAQKKLRAEKAAAATRDVYGIFVSSNTETVIDQLLASGSAVSDLNDLYGDKD